jgi:glycosyltransferase involved in cell wall biosynthesis
MRLAKSDFRLILAGKGDTEEQTQRVHALIEQHGLQHRVIVTGWISEEEKIKLTANAYACLYVPFDEDSYGYSTLEAFHSHKAVITCTDSGGTDEVIQDRFNGLMAQPTAESLAERMEYLWAKRERAIDMGNNAHHSLSLHNIDWDYAVQQLTK